MAPELVAARHDYDEAVDVYACGVALRGIFAGSPSPWPDGLETFDVFARVEAGERPAVVGAPPPWAAIIEGAWRRDPSDRPTAAALRDAAVRAFSDGCGTEASARLAADLDAAAARHPRHRASISAATDALSDAVRAYSRSASSAASRLSPRAHPPPPPPAAEMVPPPGA